MFQKSKIGRILVSSGGLRAGVLSILYLVVLGLSLRLAYALRWEFRVPEAQLAAFYNNVIWVGPVKLALLTLLGQTTGLISYFGLRELKKIVIAMVTAAWGLLAYRFWEGGIIAAPPVGVVLSDLILSVVGLAFLRLGLRTVKERLRPRSAPLGRGRLKRVAIFGAGDTGASLAREFLLKPHLSREPVAFFDDDPSKWRSRVHGIPVFGKPEVLRSLFADLRLQEVVLALPRASTKRTQELMALLHDLRLDFNSVPPLHELATGRVRVTQLREIAFEDVLRADEVEVDEERIGSLLSGKVLLVTGAGGAIGAEICRNAARFNPSRILMLDQCEVHLFTIEQDMIARGAAGIIQPIIADVTDGARMRQILGRFHPQIVIHAATHKRVALMERQPSEPIKTNISAIARLARQASLTGVEQFVLVSSLEAAQPRSVVGASLRLAEGVLSAWGRQERGRIKYSSVRVGSCTSAGDGFIMRFRRQIIAGGPVRVPHPDATRHVIGVHQAASLVLQAAAQAVGGEVFALNAGKPVKLIEVAKRMIELGGRDAEDEIEIELVGLREGERLHDALAENAADLTATEHPNIFRVQTEAGELESLTSQIDRLTAASDTTEPAALKLLIQEAVPEYQPVMAL